MTSITKAFTDVGNADAFSVNDKDNVTWSTAGTFVATCVLERTRDLQSWEIVLTKTGEDSGTYIAEHKGGSSMLYRWRCTAFTSGTATCVLADAAVTVQVVRDAAGNAVATYSESGLTLGGDIAVGGNATITGAIDATGTSRVRSTSQVDGVTASNVTKIILDASGKALVARCATANIPTGAGYAKGCLLIATDGTDQTNTLFANIGDATTANFNAATIAAD